MDVYSRNIVGWGVYGQQCASQAASVVQKAHLRVAVCPSALMLPSDNGSPMIRRHHAGDASALEGRALLQPSPS